MINDLSELKRLIRLKEEVKKPGSHPHAGRPGKVGGSLPKGATHGEVDSTAKPKPAEQPATGKSWLWEQDNGQGAPPSSDPSIKGGKRLTKADLKEVDMSIGKLNSEALERYKNSGDADLAYLAHVQGFDGKPDVIDDSEFYKYSKEEVVLYRGVSGPEYYDSFKDGPYYAGYGDGKNGTWTITARDVANLYAQGSPKSGSKSKGVVMAMTLKKGARVIDSWELDRIYKKITEQEVWQGYEWNKKNADPFSFNFIGCEKGKLATMLGYDAIVEGNHTAAGKLKVDKQGRPTKCAFVILNRTALRVLDRTYPAYLASR